jgi:hypothetical protein
MTMDEFITLMELKSPPALEEQLEAFEVELGAGLPDDYREFLVRTNGGFLGGRYRFKGTTLAGETWFAYIHHIGGFRQEPHLSLRFYRGCCLSGEWQFPRGLLWIMDDPGGNGICIGLTGKQRGRVYLWIHDMQPDPQEWDGELDTASNIILLADSFTDFIAGVGPQEDSDFE